MLNPGAVAGYQGITQYIHKENHHAASDEEPIRFDSSVVANWMDCFSRLVMADFEKEKQAPLALSQQGGSTTIDDCFRAEFASAAQRKPSFIRKTWFDTIIATNSHKYLFDFSRNNDGGDSQIRRLN